MRQKKLSICLICILLLLYAGNALVCAFDQKDDSIPIIGYHHIVPDEDKQAFFPTNMWVVSLSEFEQQMKLLKEEGYHSVTLDDVYEWKLGKKELDEKSIAITFDDGFYSTTKFAQPVLKRYGFTGAVFVIGSAINEHHGPYDPKIRQHASHADMKDEQVLQYYSHSYDLHHKDNNGFRINQLSDELLRRDIEQAEERNSIRYYAYPYGKYNTRIQAILKERGTRLAFGYNENRKAKRSDDTYALPRFNVNAYTRLDVFRAMLESR